MHIHKFGSCQTTPLLNYQLLQSLELALKVIPGWPTATLDFGFLFSSPSSVDPALCWLRHHQWNSERVCRSNEFMCSCTRPLPSPSIGAHPPGPRPLSGFAPASHQPLPFLPAKWSIQAQESPVPKDFNKTWGILGSYSGGNRKREEVELCLFRRKTQCTD